MKEQNSWVSSEGCKGLWGNCREVAHLGVPPADGYLGCGGGTAGTWWPNLPIFQEKLEMQIFM